MSKPKNKHPKGYWMGVGISIGVAIGAALGLALENTGAGLGVGIAIGAGIGASLEQKYKDNIRPLTEQEKTRQKQYVAIGVASTVILVMLFVIVFFLQAR